MHFLSCDIYQRREANVKGTFETGKLLIVDFQKICCEIYLELQ